MTNILVAIPCYGGLIQVETMESLFRLHQLFTAQHVEHTIATLSDSTVTCARNYFANRAVFEADQISHKWSHVLYIDSDSVFQATDVLKMLRADKPIIGLPFSLKKVRWDLVGEAARLGMPDNLLQEYGGEPNINQTTAPIPVDRVTQIDQVGAGMMLVNTDVLRAMVAQHPEWKYRMFAAQIEVVQSDGGNRDYAYDFFQFRIDPETKFYLTEDFFFVEEARKLGFESYLLPSAATGHIGSFEYRMNLPLVAKTGLNVRGIVKQD